MAIPPRTPDPADDRPRDEAERGPAVAVGVLLILLGVGFLVARQADLDVAGAGWPLFVLVPGLVLFALAFVVGGRGGSGFAIGGAITTVTGAILAVQNATGLWSTWAYAWALVAPGGVGLGLLVYGLVTRQRDLLLAGMWALLVGLALFLVGAFFFESIIGLSGGRIEGLDTLFAAGLVLIGAVIVVVSLTGGGRRRPD